MKTYNVVDIYNDMDIEFKLLSGVPIEIENVGYIRSLTLREITKIGHTMYNLYVNNLYFDMRDIRKGLSDVEGIEEASCFDIIYAQCLITRDEKNSFYEELVLDALSLFFNERASLSKEEGFFYLGEIEEKRIINRDNYDQVKKIIQMQNCIQETKEEEYNPANETARLAIERIMKNRAEAPKPKQNSTLQSIISGVAWKSRVGIYSVWDLTIYQLYDAYYRLLIIDDCVNIYSGIYAGTVDAKKINLKDLSWVKTTQ